MTLSGDQRAGTEVQRGQQRRGGWDPPFPKVGDLTPKREEGSLPGMLAQSAVVLQSRTLLPACS